MHCRVIIEKCILSDRKFCLRLCAVITILIVQQNESGMVIKTINVNQKFSHHCGIINYLSRCCSVCHFFFFFSVCMGDLLFMQFSSKRDVSMVKFFFVTIWCHFLAIFFWGKSHWNKFYGILARYLGSYWLKWINLFKAEWTYRCCNVNASYGSSGGSIGGGGGGGCSGVDVASM